MSKQLESTESYKAYRELQRLPRGAVKFHLERSGPGKPRAVVHLGELYCRFEPPDLNGELCGAVFKSRGALITHIRKWHSEHIDVMASDKTGNPSMEKINTARVIFSYMMKRHNELEAEPTDSQHDENVTTTRGRRKPVHNTPSTDSQDVQAPAAAPKLIPVPVYKTGNKRKQIKKGDVNYTKIEAILKKRKFKMPCNGCKKHARDQRKPAPEECNFSAACDGLKLFDFGDEMDEDFV